MRHPATSRLRTCAATVAVATALVLACYWAAPARASDDPSISAVQYNREVVRILQRKCVGCHVKNGQAMPLDTYRAVAPWSRAIREEILERRMPPWPAAAGIRQFTNDPTLSTREMSLLLAWLDGALPKGEDVDLPAVRLLPEWPAGTPDEVVTLPPQAVTTDGTTVVRRASVAAPGPARWLRGFDIVPGERTTLRAAFLFVKAPDGSEQWIGTWTPWHAMTAAPQGAAYAWPADATITVELHYNGWTDPARTLTDRSRVGLYFDRTAAAASLRPMHIAATPRGATPASAPIHGDVTLAEDTYVWAIRPRLQRGGAAVDGTLELIGTRPDGSVEPLLWMTGNPPDWQFAYVLSDPVMMPRGSHIRLVARAGTAGAAPLDAAVDVTWFGPPATAQTASASPGQ